jgi:ABC-type multidrug transport system fused ATPase/permease subunit
MAKRLSRWTALKRMSLLMKPTSPAELTVVVATATCTFLGKWLDVMSIKKRGSIIDSLRQSSPSNPDISLPKMHILSFFLLRILSSVFIEMKAVLFSVIAGRAVQSISSRLLYLAIRTVHVHEMKATKMNRVIERGGGEIARTLEKIFTAALPNILRLLLMSREVYSIFGPRHFMPLLAATAAYAAYTLVMLRTRAAYKREINRTDNSMSRRIQESISNVDLVRACCNEYVEIGNFLDEMRRMRVLKAKDAGCVGITNLGQRALYTVLFAYVAFIGAAAVSTGGHTIGDLSVLFALILSIDTSVRTLGTVAKDMGSSLVDCTELLYLYDDLKDMAVDTGADISRIDGDLEEMRRCYKRVNLHGPLHLLHPPGLPDHPETQGTGPVQPSTGDTAIEFENVSFMYSSTPVLENISFKIRKGERVAVIGESGCGKSTILKLILMFYRYRGEIRVSGKEIRRIPVADLRGSISCILQDMSLFDESIFYNVAYGRPDAEPSKVLEACRRAGLCSGKRRLYSKVGYNGRSLSGGEAQMVALARCLLKGAEIMLLDEVTAKLDTSSERKVFSLIMGIRNKTIVMVLHSLWMAEHVDKIILIENGAVKEMGSHIELMGQRGRYWKMRTA